MEASLFDTCPDLAEALSQVEGGIEESDILSPGPITISEAEIGISRIRPFLVPLVLGYV